MSLKRSPSLYSSPLIINNFIYVCVYACVLVITQNITHALISRVCIYIMVTWVLLFHILVTQCVTYIMRYTLLMECIFYILKVYTFSFFSKTIHTLHIMNVYLNYILSSTHIYLFGTYCRIIINFCFYIILYGKYFYVIMDF